MGNTARKIISEKILFGPAEEDPLTVANEIITGTRPKKWNVAGHPDHDVWVSMIELKQENRQKELIKAIIPHVYPTSQIYHDQITIEDYVTGIADWLAKEIFDRRMPKEVLPLFAELAVLRR